MMSSTQRIVNLDRSQETSSISARFRTLLIGVVLTALILILSGYALTTTPLLARTLHVSLGLAAVLVCWMVISGKPFSTRGTWLPLAIASLLVLTALFSALLQADATLASTLHVPVLILCGYLISQAVPFDIFVSWFSGAMAVFSLIAVAAWLLFIVLGLPLVGSEVTNFNGAVYNNGVVYFLLIAWDGTPIDRSMGPFWEPGLFASFIVIALLAEISFRKRPVRIWVIIALVLGIFSAQSTAGFLLVIPALALFLFKRRSTLSGIIAFLISMLALVGYSQLDSIIHRLMEFDPEVFGKLEQEALQSSSRMNVFDLNLQIFSESPVIGWGFEGANQQVVTRMADAGVAAQTSTSTYFLAALGLVGLLYTFGWFALLLDSSLSISERVIILVCFLSIINKEPHTAIMVTYVFYFYFGSRIKIHDQFPAAGQVARI